MKKIATLSLLAVGVIALTACAPTVREYDGTEVQGVTAEKILVGNTAATTGAFASVGLPFNVGLEAALNAYNLLGGFNGAKVELKHYDDGFDGAQGATFTKKLVEDDKVFALVGHFGTNTVAATVDYIKEQGVPMVYAATGVNDLYQEGAVGYNKSVMPVQPIYKTEGRVLLARALASTEGNVGLGASKVGVIYTSDDAGLGMLEGVKRQAQETKAEIIYSETKADQGTNHAAAVSKVKDCDAIIVAANQVPFSEIMSYLGTGNVNKPVITSYLSANTVTLGGLVKSGAISADRPVYTNAWLDVTTDEGMQDYLGFMAVTYLYYGITDPTTQITHENFATATAMCLNSYAMAGYCAGMIFLQGLQRVAEADEELTWLNYINAMESEEVDLPMGGTLNFANGDRLGIASLALNTTTNEYVDNEDGTASTTLVSVDEITSLEDIWAKVPANLKK